MRIYDIIEQHPEWVEAPKEHRAQIKAASQEYFWEVSKLSPDIRERHILHDLGAICDKRSEILTYWNYNGSPEAEPKKWQADRAKVKVLERLFRSILKRLDEYEQPVNSTPRDRDEFLRRYGRELTFLTDDEKRQLEALSAVEVFRDIDLNDTAQEAQTSPTEPRTDSETGEPSQSDANAPQTAQTVTDGRESLCLSSTLTLIEKAELFNELINANVFARANSSEDLKVFRTFIFGDLANCDPGHKLTISKQENFAIFISELFNNTQPPYSKTIPWCMNQHGESLKPTSLKTQGQKYNEQIKNIVEKYFKGKG